MPRLRPLGRRSRRRDDEPSEPAEPWLDGQSAPPDADALAGDMDEPFEPFVPVPGRSGYTDDAVDFAPESRWRRRRRLSRPLVPRPRQPLFSVHIRFGVLALVIVLIGGGIFGTLLKQERLERDVEVWWPAAILAGAGLWMLAALIQRRIAAFLGGAAAAGVGLSLLMDAQGIAAAEQTLLGVVLATVGLGIVIRGFLLRQQSTP